MAQELLSTFEQDLSAIVLEPATGGVFAIYVDATLLWERVRDGGFPDIKTLKQKVRDAIAPGKYLGHTDTPHHRKDI